MLFRSEEPGKIRGAALEVLEKELSVRKTEALVKRLLENKKTEELFRIENLEIKRIKENLQSALSTKVEIKGTEKRGRIEIEYYSLDDLNRIIEVFDKR